MNDLGWGRAGGNGGNSGNKGAGGGRRSGGGSVRTAHEDGACVGDGRGVEGARKASGGCSRRTR